MAMCITILISTSATLVYPYQARVVNGKVLSDSPRRMFPLGIEGY